MIYLGADHRGFQLKEAVKKILNELKLDFQDLGAFEYNENDDYVDFASAVARKVAEGPEGNRGILTCRNGAGVDIVANKFKNVRSVLGFDAEQVRLARNDDDVNVLSLPTDFVDERKAVEIISSFLNTPFESAERQKRRIELIGKLEKQNG